MWAGTWEGYCTQLPEPVYDKGEPVYLKEQDRFTVVVEWKLDLSDYGYKYVIKGENGNETVKRSDLMSMKEAEEAGHKPKDNEQHGQ